MLAFAAADRDEDAGVDANADTFGGLYGEEIADPMILAPSFFGVLQPSFAPQ
jgi:hypothetical protein